MTDYQRLQVVREWLRQCLLDGGGQDGGGSGQADVDIEFNGARYNVSIRALDEQRREGKVQESQHLPGCLCHGCKYPPKKGDKRR